MLSDDSLTNFSRGVCVLDFVTLVPSYSSILQVLPFLQLLSRFLASSLFGDQASALQDTFSCSHMPIKVRVSLIHYLVPVVLLFGLDMVAMMTFLHFWQPLV